MRKRRGFTLTELLTSLGLMAFVLGAICSLFINSLRSFQNTTTDTNLNQSNAQGMRRLTETLRSAMSVTISADGKTLSYTLPKLTNAIDPQTGEKEYIIPLETDGTNRTFTVNTAGELVDSVGNRKLMKKIRTTDPDTASSQYNQAYAPFSSTTIGSQRAITINLITAEDVMGKLRYARYKTTVVLHNK